MSLEVTNLPTAAVRPSPHNPRLLRKKGPDLKSLSDSIRSLGVLQPILVRRVQAVNGESTHEIIAGGLDAWRRRGFPLHVESDGPAS